MGSRQRHAARTHRALRGALVLGGTLLVAGSVNGQAAQALDQWPAWRGPLGTGEAPRADPPVRWSETRNVRWKVELPGEGNGSPVVWGEHVYLLAAEDVDDRDPASTSASARASGTALKDFQRKTDPRRQRLWVLALRRSDGTVAWKDLAAEALPHEEIHEDGSWASSSAVTDGARVFASFGSLGLFAYAADGRRLWQRELGRMSRMGFGEGSSPALFGDVLLVQRDHQEGAHLLALDARTGEELWRREREERSTWATPVVAVVDGRPQVVTNGSRRVRGYALEDGELLWECAGMTPNAIPTPVVVDGTAYVTSGFRGSALLAIRLPGARGDLSGTDAVRWSRDRHTPYVPSPLAMGDALYFLKANGGMLSSVALDDGEVRLDARRSSDLPNVYASPVGAAGRVYLVGLDGATVVLRHGGEHEVLAVNHLDDAPFAASPAPVGRELFLRGARHLYCLAAE